MKNKVKIRSMKMQIKLTNIKLIKEKMHNSSVLEMRKDGNGCHQWY